MSQNSKIKMSSNRSFGIIFSIIFLIISLWPTIETKDLKIFFLIFSIAFLFLGLTKSKLLTPLNILWFKFGILLGSIIAPIVMAIIYFFIVTPTGIIMKIFNKDLLNKKFNKSLKSYWIKREKKVSSMKQQF